MYMYILSIYPKCIQVDIYIFIYNIYTKNSRLSY